MCRTRHWSNAYKSGFISTEIARSGDALDTGVNGYESEFSHDVIGILTNLFTQGYYTDAHALLTEARNVVGSQGQYVDGLWTYAVPWAVYLLKTGDRAFVAQNFASEGPSGAVQPSLEDTAHTIAADRTGPLGTMEATNDIDTQGSWTTDDYESLLGLAAYAYVATAIGNTAEAAWATAEYRSLLAATNSVLGQTISRDGLDYLPCSLLQPNTANRCNNPQDANWTSPFGFGSWAWEGSLLGAPLSGPGLSLIDATYSYGFGRLRGILPPDTTGGFPTDYFYSSGYNAANGAAGLASVDHRDQGITGLPVHAGQQPERAPLVVGELRRPRPPLALGGPAPFRRTRLVAPRLGHGRREQGPAGLPGGAEGGGSLDRGPRGTTGVATRRRADLGHQLPHDRRTTRRFDDHLSRKVGGPVTLRCDAHGTRPLPAPFLHTQYRGGIIGHRRSGNRHGHLEGDGPARNGHVA